MVRTSTRSSTHTRFSCRTAFHLPVSDYFGPHNTAPPSTALLSPWHRVTSSMQRFVNFRAPANLTSWLIQQSPWILQIRPPSSSSSHTSSSCDLDRLSIHITEQRRTDSHDGARCFCGRARSSQRDILVCCSSIFALSIRDLLARDTQCNTLSVGCGDKSARFLGAGQACVNMTESNGVCTNAKLYRMSVNPRTR